MLTRRARRAFTVMEVIVTIGILAVLGAILLPALRPRVDHAHASGLINSFDQLRQAILAYQEDVGRWPRSIIQLQSRPPTGGAPNQDICGNSLPNSHFSATWSGPYIAQRVEAIGLQVGNSLISTTLIYDNLDTSPQGLANLIVQASEVDRSVWEIVDRSFDVQLDQNDGAVRWTEAPAGSDRGTLSFVMRIRGC